ncbi:MAG TPA: hypothetical protein VHQ43_00500 [Solirubrobacterales bacterium]|nr:hypothetical protein [Solirubrobacterales bacterium]
MREVPARALNGFSYVVVEEKIDQVVGLLVSEWPRGGAGGHPVFASGGSEEEVTVDLDGLQRRLARREVPDTVESSAGPRVTRRAIQRRKVAVGDVYAARLASPEAGEGPQEAADRFGVERWLEEVVDITASGREAAKAATYEALTPRLKPEVAAVLRRKKASGS